MPLPRNHLFPPGPCEIAVQTGLNQSLKEIEPGKERAKRILNSISSKSSFYGGYEFLGTTREGGRAQEILYTGVINTDYAGSDGMPADIRLSGKGMIVTCHVQNFNPATMGRLKARYYGVEGAFNKKGLITFNDMGGLLMQEGRFVSLCIRSLNATSGKYPGNEYGLWVPFCFPDGELGWDFASREQIYTLSFHGFTYMNMDVFNTPVQIGDTILPYNAGFLYSTDGSDIIDIWDAVTNPDS